MAIPPLNYKANLYAYLHQPESASQPPICSKTLTFKHEQKIAAILSDRKWTTLYENKMIALLFLDNISGITSKNSPVTNYVDLFGFGSSTLASLEWIHWIDAAMQDPRLSDTAKQVLLEWKTKELNYLPMAVIFDGWRSSPEMLKYISKEGLKYYEDRPQIEKQKIFKHIRDTLPRPPEEEVKALASGIAASCRGLKVGQSMPLLGGNVMHETRVVLTRTGEKTYTIEHFKVGGERSDTISSRDPELLFSDQYWIDYIKVKLSSIDMTPFNHHLAKLGERNKSTREQKTAQQGDTCPSQCIEAELKPALIEKAGENEYKKFKAIAAESALKEKGKAIEKELAMLLEYKAQKRSAYVKWSSLNEDQRRELCKTYEKAIKSFIDKVPSPDSSASFDYLRRLDKELEFLMKSMPPKEARQKARELCTLFPDDLVPFCLKSPDLLFKISNQFLRNMIDLQKSPLYKTTKYLSETLPKSIAPIFKPASAKFTKHLVEEALEYSEQFPEALFDDLFDIGFLNPKSLTQLAFDNRKHAKDLAMYAAKRGILDKREQDTLLIYSGPEALKTLLDKKRSALEADLKDKSKKPSDVFQQYRHEVVTLLELHLKLHSKDEGTKQWLSGINFDIARLEIDYGVYNVDALLDILFENLKRPRDSDALEIAKYALSKMKLPEDQRIRVTLFLDDKVFLEYLDKKVDALLNGANGIDEIKSLKKLYKDVMFYKVKGTDSEKKKAIKQLLEPIDSKLITYEVKHLSPIANPSTRIHHRDHREDY